MPSSRLLTVKIRAALQAAKKARILLNRRMRDSGGGEEGGESWDGPSMRSMEGFDNDNPCSLACTKSLIIRCFVMTGMTGRKRTASRARAVSAGAVAPLRALLDSAESDGNASLVARAGASNLGAYLHDLRRHPVLSRDEEHELAIAYARTHAL